MVDRPAAQVVLTLLGDETHALNRGPNDVRVQAGDYEHTLKPGQGTTFIGALEVRPLPTRTEPAPGNDPQGHSTAIRPAEKK